MTNQDNPQIYRSITHDISNMKRTGIRLFTKIFKCDLNNVVGVYTIPDLYIYMPRVPQPIRFSRIPEIAPPTRFFVEHCIPAN